ncbi:MAG: hypothetical protein R3192_12705 [Woeseiaceae bacterium]|nr:hypothetical protein [Woeseiaceae bacterium]
MIKSLGVSLTAVVAGALFALASIAGFAGEPGATGIVQSIVKAPVVADGDVTGKPFDYVINLDGSLDPQVLGRGIAANGTIKIFMPPEFDLGNLDPAFPVGTPPVFGPIPCVPGNLQCTTLVLLRGWPQDPLFPPFLFHSLSVDVPNNALVITAVKDIGLMSGVDRAPYIKQIHLILNGLTNPAPGKYRMRIEAETGRDGTLETGEGLIVVRRKTQPSVNVTSVFVDALAAGNCGPGKLPPNPNNPIYQTTSVGQDAPYVWTFLLWGKNNKPLDSVSLRKVKRNVWQLVKYNDDDSDSDSDSDSDRRGRRILGHVRISAPRGARHQDIRQIECPSLLPFAPVIANTPGVGPQPVGRLDLQFTAGNKAGLYKTVLSLKNGNHVEMVVTANAQ